MKYTLIVTKCKSPTKMLLYLYLLNKIYCKKNSQVTGCNVAKKVPETKTNINLISILFIYNICMNVLKKAVKE